MSPILRKFACFVVAIVMACSGHSLQASTASINVDLSQKGPVLNPRMYGVFLENLNHGVDGGLYAELIRNRGFEDANPPEGYVFHDDRWVDSLGENSYDAGFSRFGYFTNGLPFWSLIKEGDAAGSMSLEDANPLTTESPHSCRIEVSSVTSGRLGIANAGYWGIGVRDHEQFKLSFWARCANGFDGALTASLEDETGKLYSQPVRISGLGSQWKQFHCTLTGTGEMPKARFVLTAATPGTVWLDMVSLFPTKTFEDRENGQRADLAQMIADLKPGFVRFPGGCVIEGGTVATAYNWKRTVGPIQARTEIWGPWNYRETYGMGFYETLQFCEDLGAEPLYVGFAGETCMFRNVEDVPMPQMGWVVTNFVDAIEFANGSTASEWGRLRAQMGHKKSFHLQTVEVGNEGGTRGFPERYRLVHEALETNYPNLSYILDYSFLRRNWMNGQSSDVEDNHFYNSPEWFMDNDHLYDHRDRKLPPVYDGEVAVTSAEGGPDKGNLIAALAEGAFLMGLERNGDVVKMVSYAPLLANVDGRTDWHGLIYFDSTRAFGTVSYYLWKLFAENRPDYTLPTEVSYQADPAPPITGAIGLGTWNTAAEFKDIHVESQGQSLYSSDTSSTRAGWQTDGGNWSETGGVFQQSDEAIGLNYFGDESWTNYTVTLKARKLHGNEGFLIVFGHHASDKYWWNLGGWGDREHAIEFNQTPVGNHERGQIETGRWYDVKIEIHDRHIKCYLDGQLVHDVDAPAGDRFFATAGRDEKTGDLIVKAINVSAHPVNTALNLSGAKARLLKGTAITLTSPGLSDNNSLDAPTSIVPHANDVTLQGPGFVQLLPPNSLTVLRLKAR